MKENELKPCPFCGGKAELIHDKRTLSFADSFYVRCDNIDCYMLLTTPHRLSKEDAINIWNRRASDEKGHI